MTTCVLDTTVLIDDPEMINLKMSAAVSGV
jgi:predicted ribonuclease YlaK